MPTDFNTCAAAHVPLSQELIDLYGYTGHVVNIPRNASTQVTLLGCKALCGDGTDWYPWSKQASTLTTWIFPVIGIILQAPFMSNAFWQTIFALARWIGNPMASLSYVLWNIKVAGKCALLVDMAVPFGTRQHILADDATDFASIRDSFYLLNVMNQYTMRPHVRQKKEAEGLLRIVLFSKDLRLVKETLAPKRVEPMLQRAPSPGDRFRNGRQIVRDPSTRRAIGSTPKSDLEPEGHLNELRQKLAEDLRATRKRGAVPVYLSLLWFLFSLAISIQAAFGLLGLNSEAHDLALGCLLSWLPVLILCSVVDRNPVSPEKIQRKLNRLVDRVRVSLMDQHARELYLETIHDPKQQIPVRRHVEAIARDCSEFQEFFVIFAGQGRVRWHYGCAHAILKDIERAYVADKGRDWLRHEREARTLLVLGDVRGGLDWLDYRELWQVLAALLVVGGTIFGAFCLSFFTPTVGLGCRSGGYMIFAILSMMLMLTEMVVWWIIDARKEKLTLWIERRRPRRNAAILRRDAAAIQRAKVRQERWETCTGLFARSGKWCVGILRHILPKVAVAKMEEIFRRWQRSSGSEKLQYVFLRPLEITNTIWLIYIVCAQTFGAYNTCECHTSHWGSQDYMDFSQYSTTNNHYVRYYWIGGTVISVSTMSIGLSYVVLQWCLQSHLSTLDRRKAARGLRLVWKFRAATRPILLAYRLLPKGCSLILAKLAKFLEPCGLHFSPPANATLRWTPEVTSEQATPLEFDDNTRGRLPSSAIAPAFHLNVEYIPLVDEPASAHLHNPAGSRTPRSSDDRSVSPTARSLNVSALGESQAGSSRHSLGNI